MKKKTTIRCPYCGAEAKLRPASVVYGDATIDRSAFIYLCDRYPKCDAYVYAHPQKKTPLGTLANGDLRNKRIRAHHAINGLLKSGIMSKKDVYYWLSNKLGLPIELTHIGMFGDYMCESVIRLCSECRKVS